MVALLLCPVTVQMPRSPTDLFLQIADSHFLIILKLMVKGSLRDWFYLQYVSLTAEYRSITGIKGVGLIYWICNKPAITVFNCRNIFPISFMLFYILVDLCPAFIFIVYYWL